MNGRLGKEVDVGVRSWLWTRSRPTRIIQVSMAVAFLGLMSLSCRSFTASDFEPIEVAGGTDDVDALKADLAMCLSGPSAEASGTIIVWLEPGAAEQEVNAVEQVLASTDGVTGYNFLGVEESYAEFVEFFADTPEVIEQVEPESLPMSFEVHLTQLSQAEALIEQISPLNVVQSIETVDSPSDCEAEIDALAMACGTNQDDPLGAAVWLEPGIGGGEVIRIEQLLADNAEVVAVRHVGQAETLEEFRQFYADEPALVELVDSDWLPTRFEISVEPLSPDGITTFRTELKSLSPDVSSVEFDLAAIACL